LFLDTDRIVLKFYANRIAGASNPTYDFQFGGDEPVRTLVPIPLSVLPSQIPTLQQVVEEGRTFAETDTSTDYSFELFGGTGINKYFRSQIINNGVTLFHEFRRNLFNWKVAPSITSGSPVSTTSYTEQTSNGNETSIRTVNSSGELKITVPSMQVTGSSNYIMPRSKLGTKTIGCERIYRTQSTLTAENSMDYDTANTACTVTDPTGVSLSLGGMYTVYVSSGTAIIGGETFSVGSFIIRYYDTVSATWKSKDLNNSYLPMTANFTALLDTNYTANGTLTVTDPTPVTNKGYIVHVIGGTATIGGVGYTTGALVYRYYDGSSWISTNMNSAITIDATPTDGSSNAVSSNGVFDALELKQNNYTNGLEYFNDFEGSIPNANNGGAVGFTIDGRLGKYGNSTDITYPNIAGSTSINIGAPLLRSTGSNTWIGVGSNPLQGILLGNGIYEFNTLIKLNNLPDTTDRIISLFGLTDTMSMNSATPAVNAIAFVLENFSVTNAPSGSSNWQCITVAASVKTTTITSVAMSTNFIKLSILINANASSVGFYIDNVLVATHTTNIPTVRLANFVGINKRVVGTIPMGFYLDYFHYKYDYITKRL
jgi:hypothetical protein